MANYPWDGTPDKTTAYTAAPDDATFLAMASTYAQAHKKMALPDNKARRAAVQAAPWLTCCALAALHALCSARCARQQATPSPPVES